MQTIQQKRAKFALEQVKNAQANTNQSEFKSYAASFPSMIHTNGLGQAAAFFYSQKGTHLDLYQILSNWLCQEGQPYSLYQDLLDGITRGDMATYRLAQIESQALLDWVKKFAKAFMEE